LGDLRLEFFYGELSLWGWLSSDKDFWAAIFSLCKDSSNSNSEIDSLEFKVLFRALTVLVSVCLVGQVDRAVMSDFKSLSKLPKKLYLDWEFVLDVDFNGVLRAMDFDLLICFLATSSGNDSWVLRLSAERLPREKSSEFPLCISVLSCDWICLVETIWIFIGVNSAKDC